MKTSILISVAVLLGATSLIATQLKNDPLPQVSIAQAQSVSETPFVTTSDAVSSQPISIVELFTSQGCSSCPPANSFAAKLSEDDEKLVLTYAVTYWDYLGWKDTFGAPEFTARQRSYGKALGTPNIYTPQLVLNGSAHSPRYTRKDVESMTLPDSMPLAEISVSDGRLVVSSTADTNVKLVIVSYSPGVQSVDVRRGENGGRTLELANVVTNVTAADWSGQVLKTDVKAQDGRAYAALFHDPKTAKITTAAVYAP